MEIVNNIQSNRLDFEKLNIYKFLKNNSINSRILIGNYGFIKIPKDINEKVRKIYVLEEYFLKELKYYCYFKNELIIPNIIETGNFIFEGKKYFYIDFENIRKIRKRFKNFFEIKEKEIGKILSIIHKKDFDGKKVNVHGNIHSSNFFISEKGLGIFDFVSFHQRDLEYDFSTIYYNTDYNDNYISNILKNYELHEYFSYNKMYIYTLLKIKEEIKYNYNLNEFDIKRLKIDYKKIKEKICPTT